MPDTEPTEESVLALATQFDAGKDIDNPEQAAVPEDKQAAEPVAKSVEAEGKDKNDPDVKGEKSAEVSKDSEAKESVKPDAKEQSKRADDDKRKNKTWQEINAEKEALKAEKEAIAREKAEIQRVRASTTDVYRDKHGATKRDYLEVAKQLRAKGESDNADAAERLAAEVEREEQQFKQQRAVEELNTAWKKNYDELAAKHPELQDMNSDLYKETFNVVKEYELLQRDPNGLKYAVRAAEIALQAREFEGTKAEFAKLKSEHEKLQKKLTIAGGSPTSTPTESKTFDQMSLKEQEAYLSKAAYEHDRERGYAT